MRCVLLLALLCLSGCKTLDGLRLGLAITESDASVEFSYSGKSIVAPENK